MTLYIAPGAPFYAAVANAPSGLAGTIGVRISSALGGTDLTPRQTTGITEPVAGSGIYFARLTAPPTDGAYEIVWDDGSGLVVYASEDLHVTTEHAPPEGIEAEPGDAIEATVVGGAPGLVGTIAVRIIEPATGTVMLPRQTTGIVEVPAGSGIYRAALTAPSTVSFFAIIWDDGANWAYEALTTADAVTSPIRPTVNEVAALERTRTVTAGGNEVGTFTDQTRPTAQEVDDLIDFALTMVLGQPAYLRSKAIVTLLTALLIEESYFRDDAGVQRFRDLLMRLGFTIPIGGAGGSLPASRQVDSVVMRGSMADYDPYYPKPVPVPNWPYEGANT